jgi:hypothetical protein
LVHGCPQPSGTERFVTVSSGSSFTQVAEAILPKQARLQNPDDVEAEVRRLEALGATRWDHQQERGFDFWVMRDLWGNGFCVLQPNFPELLARRRHGRPSGGYE